MARFNPYTLDRPEPTIEPREFTDPGQPDRPLELTLRVVREAPFKFRVISKMNEYITEYVLGRPTGKMPKKGELPKRYPPTKVYSRSAKGRQRIDIDEETCKFIAVIEMMQLPEEGDEPYSFQDLVQMAVVIPDAFVEAGVWAYDLLNDALGNAAEDDEEREEDEVPVQTEPAENP